MAHRAYVKVIVEYDEAGGVSIRSDVERAVDRDQHEGNQRNQGRRNCNP